VKFRKKRWTFFTMVFADRASLIKFRTCESERLPIPKGTELVYLAMFQPLSRSKERYGSLP
jgi:hypothetical protein